MDRVDRVDSIGMVFFLLFGYFRDSLNNNWNRTLLLNLTFLHSCLLPFLTFLIHLPTQNLMIR